MLTLFTLVCPLPTLGLWITPIPLQAGQISYPPRLIRRVDCTLPLPLQNLQVVNFSEGMAISNSPAPLHAGHTLPVLEKSNSAPETRPEPLQILHLIIIQP